MPNRVDLAALAIVSMGNTNRGITRNATNNEHAAVSDGALALAYVT